MSNNQATPFISGWSDGWLPDPELWLDEWSDANVHLSRESSAEPGRWRTDRTPYLRGIMRELSPASLTQRIIFMKSAQVGGTQVGLNWIGYIVHHTPGPMLIVEPTVDLAKRFSKQRLDKLIADCPVLQERVSAPKSRDSSNTQLSKEFPGGIMILTGANSAAGLRSMPARFAFLDEVDAYPQDVDDEGDPISLAEKRTTTFQRRKIFLVSTPIEEETSRINAEWKRSDQRRFFVPCPHCDHFQSLRWRDPDGSYCLVFDPAKPEAAAYRCESCGALIEERHKTAMLARGEWRPTATSATGTVGFHISALYSPLGWKSWGEIAAEFLAAKASPEKLKTWVNTTLGEPWQADYSKRLDAQSLAARCDQYPAGICPEGGLVAVAGIDVQDDRLAVVIRAFGRDEESWLVRHLEIHGDTLTEEPWRELDDLLLAGVPHESGGKLPIRAALVDSGDGDRTQRVYDWTRRRRSRLIFPIKGMSVVERPALGKPSLQDVNYRGETIKNGVKLYPLGVSTLKATVVGRIANPRREENLAQYHWHDGTSDQYFSELTAERQAIKYQAGRPIRYWKKKDGDRNEAFDCEIYAYAALILVQRYHPIATLWDKAEAALRMSEKVGAASPISTAEDTPPPEPQSRPSRLRHNFATAY